MYSKLSLLIFIFIVVSCKRNKDNMIDISGNVIHAITDQNIGDVQVLLEFKGFGGSSYSNTYTEIETTTTHQNGTYSFSFENRNAIEFRIKFSIENFYSEETTINPDDLDLTDINIYDKKLNSRSYMILNINNSFPQNNQDQIVFNFNDFIFQDPGPGSCFSNIISLTGSTADTTIECQVYGDQNVNFDYFVTKNNITNQYSGNVLCSTGDTIVKNINY